MLVLCPAATNYLLRGFNWTKGTVVSNEAPQWSNTLVLDIPLDQCLLVGIAHNNIKKNAGIKIATYIFEHNAVDAALTNDANSYCLNLSEISSNRSTLQICG